MSLTRGHSCVLCQQRKVRCDLQKPCSNCIRAQVECKVVAPQPARRRKKKLHERDLIERLKKYEALMTQHGIDFDSVGNVGDETTEAETDATETRTTPESSTQERGPRRDGNRRSNCQVPARIDHTNIYTGAPSGLHITMNIGQPMTCYKFPMMKALIRLQFIMPSIKCSLMRPIHFPLVWVAQRHQLPICIHRRCKFSSSGRFTSETSILC